MSKVREVFKREMESYSCYRHGYRDRLTCPGRRLRLHPDDYFAMGMDRGAIVERWFSSITHVETEGAEEFEGMSFVNVDGDTRNRRFFSRSLWMSLGADLDR